MANPAILVGIEFRINKCLMNICMTVPAVYPYIPERPFSLFLMAQVAWLGCMSACQRELPAVMLFKCIGELVKTHYTVACRTVCHNASLDKLAFMIIGMAVRTAIMLHGIGEFCLVAGFTVN